MGGIKEFLKRNENGYLFADITLILGLVVLFGKKDHIYFGLILMIFIIVYLMTLNQGTKVINNYNKDIRAKDADFDVVHIVKSGEYKGNVDGIKVDGKVYKLPDGVRATVTKNGKIRVYSLFGYFLYLTCGGELTKAPDARWYKLFPYHE